MLKSFKRELTIKRLNLGATLAEKVWLNSKYIKTKQNCKLEAKFFGLFRVLHHVGKQAYKLKLPKKWKIYDVFYVSLLE